MRIQWVKDEIFSKRIETKEEKYRMRSGGGQLVCGEGRLNEAFAFVSIFI